MERDAKLGYGFLLVGAAVPYLADKLFGAKVALIIAALVLIVGIVFLVAAHNHNRSLIRRSWYMTVWIFTLYGAGIGALGGGMLGAIAHLRPAPENVAGSKSSSDLSNAQVKDGARDLARRLRDLQQQINQDSSRSSARFAAALAAAQQTKGNAAKARAIQEVQANMMRESSDQASRHEAQFGQLRAESRNVINLLQNRVPPPQPLPSELVQIVLSTGPLAGPNPVGSVADYIDQLADLVPVNR